MKKSIILTLIVIFASIILIILSRQTYVVVMGYCNSDDCVNSSLKFLQENGSTIFSIDKIICFSSADAKVETNSNSSFQVSNLYQYTDIAIYLNPVDKNLTAQNTLKSVFLSDIKFEETPSEGTPNLYFKDMYKLGKSEFNSDNLITDSLKFETTSENKLDSSKPILFNNCANPITLCYVNSKIKGSYTLIDDTLNISHNGTLLKRCGITLSSIACKLSFKITITNNLDEKYSCPVSINIPLSSYNTTIYDGTLKIDDNDLNYKFIKIND